MEVCHWGLTPYKEALEKQLQQVEEVYRYPEDLSAEKLFFCSHPPVVTLGKKAEAHDVLGWTGDVVPVQRGGRATYHGPGQVVVYPILHLGFRGQDLYRYLRLLEKAIIFSLKHFDLEAYDSEVFKQRSLHDHHDKSLTGVWVGERKIASLGVAVKRWVSYHGLAINLENDPLAFKGISPCGFSADTMVSVEELKGEKINRQQFENYLANYLQEFLIRS